MVRAAVVCVFGVTGIVDATGIGYIGCAGLAGAGCGMEMWGLAGVGSLAVVASETVSAGLTLHSHRCHVILCSSKQYHHWCIPGRCPWVVYMATG